MPRAARTRSSTGVYHIMLRGVNRQRIFEDDEDSLRFLTTLYRFKEEQGVRLYAWCLMGNHAHLLLGFGDASPELLMKKLSCSYVPYFNRKYDRVGHLFQDRFRSENVEDEAYLAAVVRYIHQSPAKAGIAAMEDYPWSSYREYTGVARYADTASLLSWFGGVEAFREFMAQEDEEPHLDEELPPEKVKEPEKLLSALLGGVPITQLSSAGRKELVCTLAENGLSAGEIIRLTGFSSASVYRALG